MCLMCVIHMQTFVYITLSFERWWMELLTLAARWTLFKMNDYLHFSWPRAGVMLVKFQYQRVKKFVELLNDCVFQVFLNEVLRLLLRNWLIKTSHIATVALYELSLERHESWNYFAFPLLVTLKILNYHHKYSFFHSLQLTIKRQSSAKSIGISQQKL